MTVVDAHHHLWDPATGDYPWMTDDLAVIRRRFGPDDLAPLLAAAGIDASVLVQTRSSEDETREFLATAADTTFIRGVVGWTDLTADDVADRIAALRAAPGGDRLVAIRHQVHDEDNPAWLTRADVHRGLGAVADADLAYDLLVRTRELPAAVAAVRAVPHGRFVLDHLAKPPLADGDLTTWRAALAPLAAEPNVACKLSGMVTEADWASWSIDDLRPAAETIVELFGPARTMFGSDWPVSLLAAPYEIVYETARELLGDLGAGDLGRVFGGTAIDVYRLGGL